ncbi:receptor-type tyrosine-protein phosphatase beta-like isoform X1 [Anomaloglossus baeobatrachus]|uniref:receptor-type tyrosine-protein phosphatase beta-like isoform X1 n=1 Tax=Anomaloglossus baeobatrachus TaxID=238106 RepID=UPI003F50BEEE
MAGAVTVYFQSSINQSIIEDLTPGNLYSFQVFAVVGESNVTGNGLNISAYTKPNIVKNLITGIITTTSISLSWEKPDGNASSYEIQILGDLSFNKTVTSTSDTIEGLIPGNYYTLLVTAVVEENNVSGNSVIISVYTKPERVKNLMPGIITTTSVSLSWEKPDGNESSYYIQILGDPTFNKTVNSTTDTIEGLTPGNSYTLLVTAVVGGNSVAGNSMVMSVYTKPNIVKNLITEIITTTFISLSWEKPDGNASSYEIRILGDPTFNKTVTSTSDTIDGLTPGNYYTLLVTAVVGENNVSGNSVIISVYTKPERVKNLMSGIITTTSISLSWEKPDGNASSYYIQNLGDPTFNKTVTSTSETIEGLTPGNYYTLLVTAVVGENGVSGNSMVMSVYTKPNIVKNLMTELITTTSISLIWEKPDGNASSYEIQILGDPTFNKTVTSTSDTIDGLTPGNYYTLLVTAVVGENNVSGNSVIISVYTKPECVKNLMSGLITTTSISLSWEKPDGNASSYVIQILGDPTFNKTVTSTSDTIDALTPGNYYTLLVTAVVGGNSVAGNSMVMSVYTKPNIVKNLMTGIITTTSISLSWEKPDGNASSYEIQILGDPPFNKTVTSTSDTIEGLTPGNYYTLLVTAVVGENNMSGNSVVISVYTKPERVKNLMPGVITTTSISLSWEKPDGNTSSYYIQILGDPTFNKTVTSTNITSEGLTPGNYYIFLVSVLVGENNVTGDSSIISVYTKPDVVKNPMTGIITTTSISLSWEKPDGNASSYVIQILGDPTFNKTVTSSSDTIEGLTPGNYYTLLVTAVVGENNVTGNSAEISVYTKPERVKNLMSGIITTTSVSLTWGKPDGNTSAYYIQILGDPTFNKTVTSTNITSEGLTPGNYYIFLVSGVVGANNTGDSSIIYVYTKPNIVKNLMTGIITTTSISLSWEKPDGNASSYKIQILGDPSFNKTVTSTSDTIEGLTPGNYYTLLVTAVVGENNVSGNSVVISVYTKPEVVKNLMTQIITTTSISLIWGKPDGNTSSYVIQILGDPTFNKTVTSTSDTIDGLTPGNYYTLLVTAVVGENNVSGNSSEISMYTRPATVTELKASTINSSTINVSWNLPDGNRSSYLVEVIGNPMQTFTVFSESVIIANLTSGNQYTVRISAVAGNGLLGGNSNIFILGNISATLITTTSFWLHWDPYIGDNITYNISVYGEPSSTWTVNTTTIQITNLTSGNFYNIQISAYNRYMQMYGYVGRISLYTNPGMVRNFQVTNISTNSINLSWLPPQSNYSCYLIEVTGDIYKNEKMTSESFTVSGLTPGNQYTVTIRAVTGENVFGNSTENIFFTRPEKVKNLTVSSITDTSVTLSWLPPEGRASSYLIQIQEDERYNKTTTLTEFTVQDLTPGTQYTFLVSSLTGYDTVQGDNVSTSNYTKPGSVKNMTAEYITTTSFTLNWLPPDGGVSGYLVQINGNVIFTANTTYSPDGLSPGNVYNVVVSSLLGDSKIMGQSSEIAVKTNANSLFITLKYSSSADNSEVLIIREINRIIQKQFSGQNVTAVLKQTQKV